MKTLTHASMRLPIQSTDNTRWKENLLHAARSYCSLSGAYGTIIKSATVGNRSSHLIELHKEDSASLLATTLKIVKIASYILTLFILPLGAMIANKVLTALSQHSYYKDSNNPSDRSSFQHFLVRGDLEAAQGLYHLKPTVLEEPCKITLANLAFPCGKVEMMKWLLEVQGEDLFYKDDLFRNLCLYNQTELAEWLITKKGSTILTQVNAEGLFPFEICCHVALDKKFNCQEKARQGATWLYNKGAAKGVFLDACLKGRFDTAATMYELFPDLLNQKDDEGKTVAQISIETNHYDLFKALYDMSDGRAFEKLDLTKLDLSKRPFTACYLHEKDAQRWPLSVVIDAFKTLSLKREQEPVALRELCKIMSQATKKALLLHKDEYGKTLFENACFFAKYNSARVLYELYQETNLSPPKISSSNASGRLLILFLEKNGCITRS